MSSRERVVVASISACASAAGVTLRALPETDVVILSDYGKGGLAHISEMIRSARRAGKRVLVDPKGDDYARYKGASIITPNVAELRDVVGTWKDEKDLKARATALRRAQEQPPRGMSTGQASAPMIGAAALDPFPRSTLNRHRLFAFTLSAVVVAGTTRGCGSTAGPIGSSGADPPARARARSRSVTTPT